MNTKEELDKSIDLTSLSHFEKFYDPAICIIQRLVKGGVDVFDLLNDSEAPRKRFYINDGVTQCRFCGCTDESKFKKIAHAVPECIGNKIIRGQKNECDDCNTYFATLESSFAEYVLPFNSLHGIKGKNGTPTYKKNDGTARVYLKEPKKIVLEEQVNTESLIKSKSGDSFTLEFKRKPYIPRDVYKTLLKMALSIMPKPLFDEFLLSKQILMDKGNQPYGFAQMMFTFFPGFNRFNELALIGYKRKANNSDAKVPYFQFAVLFGGIMLQICVPHSSDNGKTVTMTAIPTPYDNNDVVGCKSIGHINLSSPFVCDSDFLRMNMRHGGVTEVDPKGIDDL